MKISTKNKLVQVIKEEIRSVLSEGDDTAIFNSVIQHLKAASNEAAKLSGNPLSNYQKDKLGMYLQAIWEDSGQDPDEYPKHAFESTVPTQEASAKDTGSGKIKFKGGRARELYAIVKNSPDAIVYCMARSYSIDIDDLKQNPNSRTFFGITKDGGGKEMIVADIEFIDGISNKVNEQPEKEIHEVNRTEPWYNIGIKADKAARVSAMWCAAGIKFKIGSENNTEVSYVFKTNADHQKALQIAKSKISTSNIN